MSFYEAIGVLTYLVVLWVVSAAAAGAVLWGTGLGYYVVVRAVRRLRGEPEASEDAGRPHPTRKHGRRILPQEEPRHAVVRHRVFPLL